METRIPTQHSDTTGSAEGQILRERVEATLARGTFTSPVVRVEVAVPQIDFFRWLRGQEPDSCGYWCDRENGFELAGLGRAHVLTGQTLDDYRRLMRDLHALIDQSEGDIRYLGGFQFQPDTRRDETWHWFKGYRFILPRFELVRRDGRTLLACNFRSDEDPSVVRAAFDRLRFPGGDPDYQLPTAFGRTNNPGRGGWVDAIRAALASIAAGQLQKIVLARKSSVFFNKPLNPVSLLWHLRKATGKRFYFIFQPGPGHAFVGGSPERLYRRDGRRIQTEALAGTRIPGSTLHNAVNLSTDPKERLEHQLVVDGIRQTLSGLCDSIESDNSPSLLDLGTTQHLITSFSGQLRAGVSDSDILAHMHPTPALGGTPRETAMKTISSLEHFHRGWFGGPVGWISRDVAQFSVGIRSCLVDEMALHLFSGAGIVEGSIPEREWDEIEGKIADYKSFLGF